MSPAFSWEVRRGGAVAGQARVHRGQGREAGHGAIGLADHDGSVDCTTGLSVSRSSSSYQPAICTKSVSPARGASACRAAIAACAGQPTGELGVEVSRAGENPPGHERGLEPPVAALHDPLGLRVPGWQQHERGRQRPHERPDTPGPALSSPDTWLVVPDQPTRNRTQLPDQLPRPQQQILGLAGRDHPPDHEPGVRRHNHQHRQQLGAPVLQRDLLRWEPQITLRCITCRPDQAIGRIDRPMLRAQLLHVLTEPSDRALPPDAFGQHRRGHVRRLGEQGPHPRLDYRERRRPRPPLIPRRRGRVHRLDDRGPRDPQPLRDPRVRHALPSEPPDQRPVLQSDHTPIVECSLFTAETVQFSSAANSALLTAIDRGPTRKFPSAGRFGDRPIQ